MLYKVTEVEFDFEDDDGFPEKEYQEEVVQRVKNVVWAAEDEDDLVDVISDNTGWCILSLEAVAIQ